MSGEILTDDIHIAGLLVQGRPEHIDAIAAAIVKEAGAEVRGKDASKLVVIYEADGSHAVMAFIDRLKELPGVLNVGLVYQHVESAADLEETIDVDHTPGIHQA